MYLQNLTYAGKHWQINQEPVKLQKIVRENEFDIESNID